MRRSRRVALSRWPSADSTRPLTLPRHSSNAALEDGIDVALRLGVDVPASDISDWLELAGMPGAPEASANTDLPKRSLASGLTLTLASLV
jgi:hypothetical protein